MKQKIGKNSVSYQCNGNLHIDAVGSSKEKTVYQAKGILVIDGNEIENPPRPIFGHQVSIKSGNKLYINGKLYDEKNKCFKFSIIGLLKLIFS